MSFALTRRRMITTGLAAGASLPLAQPAHAQAYPSKPIKLIVGFPPGGGTDLFARAYGDFIAQKTGQTVIVENKTGAGGIIGAQALKAAPNDGYTLMFTISATMIMNRVLYKSLPYDADKDFVLISYMSAGALPMVVHKSTGAKSVAEFYEYAKKNKVTWGAYGQGSYPHVAAIELNRHYGTNIESVQYRGEAPMWQDFNAGVIQAALGSYNASRAILEAGTGVAVAVSSLKRSPKLPDVPTFKELGIPSKLWDVNGFVCLVGPTGMPQEAVEKLSALMVEGGKSERVVQLVDNFGADEGARDHKFFRELYEHDKPIWIELLTGLGLTPQ